MDNQRKIIDVATKLISQKGYHGASMSMIAEKVGITKSTIFHHFKNKEAILLAILEETVPHATYNLMLIVNDKELTPLQKLHEFFKMHLKLVKEQGLILNVYLGESRHLGKRNRETYIHSRKIYTDLVKQIIREIQRESDCNFDQLEPTIVANAILGMCNWAVTWYKNDGKMQVDAVSEQFYKMVIGNSNSELTSSAPLNQDVSARKDNEIK
jgi:TetR/AcrR family transcriptional regulator, cholesterol catabolism regulator